VTVSRPPFTPGGSFKIMTQTTASPVRARVRPLSFFVMLIVPVGLLGGCVETRRANGEACLKDQDCLTGICSQLVCAAAPPTTNVQANADGGVTEAGGGADTGGGTDGGAEAEAAVSESGSGEAAADGGGD
jgi:hypothetical protein